MYSSTAKGSEIDTLSTAEEMGGASWGICGYGHPMVCIVYCSIQLLVITGATDGIGREFALQLAKAGFGVVLVSRNPEKLQKLANEISEPHYPDVNLLTLSFSCRA